MFVLHVGTNDLLNNKERITPHALIEKYRELVQNIRQKGMTNNICILGLLPVLFESLDDIWDRKFVNAELCKLADEENVKFLSFWSEFAHSHDYTKYFNSDGLHLSKLGESKLGILLNDFIENFHIVRVSHCLP
jgi:lysophospholipase L1-like esterase